MAAFTKKPVTIEAVRWDGNMTTIEPLLAKASTQQVEQELGETALQIPTLEGWMRAEVGDWIICGVKGELYPCKPDIFAATYTEARELPSRLTPTDVQSVIVSESYHRLPGTTFMVCFLTLRNGHVVTGESACADPALYDQATGEKYARENAVSKIWTLEGYLLRQRLSDAAPV